MTSPRTAYLVSRVTYPDAGKPSTYALGIQGCGAPVLVPVATIFNYFDAEDFAQVQEERQRAGHVVHEITY